MPGIVRVDLDSHIGHAGPLVPFHKTPYGVGSPNVFVNGSNAVRVDDTTKCGDVALKGSSKVYINGKPVHRKGDATAGHAPWVPNAAETGSEDVYAGG